MARLRPHADLNLGTPHNDLLQLLGTFYKTLRYDGFALSSVYEGAKEAKEIQALLAKHLQVEFPKEASFLGTHNNDRYRSSSGARF